MAGTDDAAGVAPPSLPLEVALVLVRRAAGRSTARAGRRWLAHRALGGRTGTSEHDPAIWWMIPVDFAVVLVVGGPVGEGFGWRGYALSRLQRLMGPVPASLLRGLVWDLWHLPRMLGPASVQHLVPWWIFSGQVLVNSVLYTWLLNRAANDVRPTGLGAGGCGGLQRPRRVLDRECSPRAR